MPVGDERRALQLFNPGLDGRWATTNNLIAAVQVLLPGEVARAHRHTPTAIRFIIEGSGAYTAVDGERVYMEPGDLILTPSWSWHDHGNETKDRIVWMDGLDIPLIASLEAMFFQFYTQTQVPASRPAHTSLALYGTGQLNPTWVKEKTNASPLLLYSWEQTWKAFDALRGQTGSAFDGISLEYRHPQTGGTVLPTMGCRIQLLRPNEHTQAHRHTGSAVYHVVQGQGRTIIDGRALPGAKATSSPCRPGRCTNISTARPKPTRCCSRSKTPPCSTRSVSTTKKNSAKMAATRKLRRRSAREKVHDASVSHRSWNRKCFHHEGTKSTKSGNLIFRTFMSLVPPLKIHLRGCSAEAPRPPEFRHTRESGYPG